MQPYFVPYLGYFQLIQAADFFVIYDDVEYTKKGWVNRNRINVHGKPAYITLPLRSAPDTAKIVERSLAGTWAHKDRGKLINRIREAYRRAPYFDRTMPLVEDILRFEDTNLFAFIHHSVRAICSELGIDTPIERSSRLPGNAGSGQERVLALCSALGADRYTNPVSGRHLYSVQAFAARGIQLQFLSPALPVYPQPGEGPFLPGLSIIDALMCAGRDEVRGYVEAGTIA